MRGCPATMARTLACAWDIAPVTALTVRFASSMVRWGAVTEKRDLPSNTSTPAITRRMTAIVRKPRVKAVGDGTNFGGDTLAFGVEQDDTAEATFFENASINVENRKDLHKLALDVKSGE